MGLLLVENQLQLHSELLWGAALLVVVCGPNRIICLELYGQPVPYNDLDPNFALISALVVQMACYFKDADFERFVGDVWWRIRWGGTVRALAKALKWRGLVKIQQARHAKTCAPRQEAPFTGHSFVCSAVCCKSSTLQW